MRPRGMKVTDERWCRTKGLARTTEKQPWRSLLSWPEVSCVTQRASLGQEDAGEEQVIGQLGRKWVRRSSVLNTPHVENLAGKERSNVS